MSDLIGSVDEHVLDEFESQGINADWIAIRRVRELDEAIPPNMRPGRGARRYRSAVERAYDIRRAAAVTMWSVAFDKLTPAQQDRYRALERADWTAA